MIWQTLRADHNHSCLLRRELGYIFSAHRLLLIDPSRPKRILEFEGYSQEEDLQLNVHAAHSRLGTDELTQGGDEIVWPVGRVKLDDDLPSK